VTTCDEIEPNGERTDASSPTRQLSVFFDVFYVSRRDRDSRRIQRSGAGAVDADAKGDQTPIDLIDDQSISLTLALFL